MKSLFITSGMIGVALLGISLEVSYGQGAPLTLSPPVKIQATITNTAALHVEKSGSQPSAVEIYPNYGGRDLRFVAPDGAGGQQVMSYFNDSGVFHNRVKTVVSGTASGTPLGSTISAPTADPMMLGIWSDILGSAMVIRPNQYDPAPPATNASLATMDGTGKYRFSIQPDGVLRFAAANSSTFNSAGFDTTLSRSGANQLLASGSFSAASIKDTASIITLLNNSGVAVSDGTLVVLDTSVDNAFLRASTDVDTKVIGVVQGTINAGASGPVAVQGVRELNVTGTINRGDRIVASTTVGSGRRVAAGETVPPGSIIGRATGAPVSGKANVLIGNM